MRWRIRTLMVVVAWWALFSTALSLDRPDEWWGWLDAAIAVFFLMVPTVVFGGGFLLANLHDAISGINRAPAWVARVKAGESRTSERAIDPRPRTRCPRGPRNVDESAPIPG